MTKILIRLTRYCAVAVLNLPLSLWIKLQWANLRFVETQHLTRLDDYLLKDMGLKIVAGKIEAVDVSRIDHDRYRLRTSRDVVDCHRRISENS